MDCGVICEVEVVTETSEIRKDSSNLAIQLTKACSLKHTYSQGTGHQTCGSRQSTKHQTPALVADSVSIAENLLVDEPASAFSLLPLETKSPPATSRKTPIAMAAPPMP